MRLREYFYDENEKDDKDEKVSERFQLPKKSYFTPNKGRDSHLDLYIELVKADIVENLKNKGSLNISKEENDAFYELLHHPDIVIRPADKGSGIVVIDREKYLTELKEEVEQCSSYEKTDDKMIDKCHKKVKKLVNAMYKDGAISKDLHAYLIPKYATPGKLKGNPKLHKQNAPYRTIVSGIGTPTEKLAEVAEYELNEYVESSPSYVRDTTDFINKLKDIQEPIPENCILFCFDVCKLYPSVPKKEGLQACKEALSQRTSPLIDSDNVLKMIETVLENNVFQFGENNYIQTDGIAIGSKLGKNFACTYMRKWDEQLLNAIHKPLFYKRFIDDGFGLWVGSEEQLLEFANHANSIHDNIKVELRFSYQQIEFLDTIVKLENGHIYTDLYVKPSDKQLYLNQKSCHPPSTKRGLAYGLGLRLKRICEKKTDYEKQRKSLKYKLRERGYSGKGIETQLEKVDMLDRETLLLENKRRGNKKNSSRVPLVLTYSQLLPDIHKIVSKHSRVLHESERMKQVFKDPPIVAFRRDKNLNDTLVHGKTNNIVRSCHSGCKTDCLMCEIVTTHPVMDTAAKNEYRVPLNTSCREKNVVYAISCERCKKVVYVGETERQLNERMKEHLRDVRLRHEKPINSHFQVTGHSSSDLRFTVLKKMYFAERTERQINESAWIKKLQTVQPSGCNVKDAQFQITLLDAR